MVGAVIGALFNIWGANPTRDWILHNVMNPVGQAFLRGLFMIVVPLVFSSLAVSVANLGSIQHVGRLGIRLGAFYVISTLIAAVIGLSLASALKPGANVSKTFVESARKGMDAQVTELAQKSAGAAESLWPGIVNTIIPKNILSSMAEGQMLAIIFVSILFGVTLLKIERDKSAAVIKVLSAVSDASIVVVDWIMKLAPYAVAALVISAISKFGMDIMGNVLKYVGVVVLGYLIHFFGVFSLLIKFLVRMPVSEFYKRAVPVFATSFSTSSSNATIPTTIETLEHRFGVPESITSFSIPLGATVNMNGTALFEALAAIFVAQVFGIDLSFTAQFTIVALVLLSAVGVAGVPGGSIPLLMSVMATVGIPPEGIALILGVDRLLDMGRTVVNVTGDMVGALYLARVEKALPRFK